MNEEKKVKGRYFYLMLKENFYDSDDMVLLESMENGYKYSNILLKLYLRSLKDKGKLMYKDRIPYSVEMLAKLTRHDPDTVRRAIDIFQQMGIIEILDNGAIFMMDIENYIGKSSTEADRRRAYDRRIAAEKKKLLPSNETCEESCENSCEKSHEHIDLDLNPELEPNTNTIVPYEKIKDLYHSICTSYPKVIKLSDNRKKTIAARYKEHNCDIEKFKALFMKAEASDFLKGINKKNWKADFDWLLNQTNMIKVLEDKYKNKEDNNGGSAKQSNRENGSEYEQFCG